MGGEVSSLIEGPLHEAPWDLVSAVNHALVVLSWFENLPRDEQPPKWIWWSDDLLEEWFENVTKSRNSGKRANSYQSADDVPMEDNSLADDFRPVFV